MKKNQWGLYEVMQNTSNAAFKLLMFLCISSKGPTREEQEISTTIGSLSAMTGLSVPTVRRARLELLGKGLLEKIDTPNHHVYPNGQQRIRFKVKFKPVDKVFSYKVEERFLAAEQVERLINLSRQEARDSCPASKCKRCGIEEGTHVHHKDCDPLNNNFSNLVRLCPTCHRKEHAKNEHGGVSYLSDFPYVEHSLLNPTKKYKKEKKERGGNEKNEHPALSVGDEIVLLDHARRVLGTSCGPNSAYGQRARKAMRARIKEGFTKEQLLDACRYAMNEWDSGNRWRGLKDLTRVWTRDFESHLATEGKAGRKGPEAPQFRKGEEQREWLADIDRRIARDLEEFEKSRGQRSLEELDGVE